MIGYQKACPATCVSTAGHDFDAADVVFTARQCGITAYDAAYLWLAGMLGADLVTLDERLARASATLASGNSWAAAASGR